MNPVDALSVLLDEELAAAKALGEALAGESQALRGRDAAALDAAVEHKTHCVVQMATTGEARRQACEQLGLQASADGLVGLEMLVRAREIDAVRAAELERRWLELMTDARTLKERNELNERVVSRAMASTEALIAAFRGEHTDQALYGRGTGAPRADRTRPIASA